MSEDLDHETFKRALGMLLGIVVNRPDYGASYFSRQHRVLILRELLRWKGLDDDPIEWALRFAGSDAASAPSEGSPPTAGTGGPSTDERAQTTYRSIFSGNGDGQGQSGRT